MLFLMAGCRTCGENTDGTWDVFSRKGARWSGGVQVECWLYNEHYSAQMAVQRGLSVQRPETQWLDFPCVAIVLSPWTERNNCSCSSRWIALKQFNESPLVIGFREETGFLFNANMWDSVMMTFISRGSQLQPHIVGCSVLKYDILLLCL